jgi:CubicO group peptidase (beta-lactamase class C family)
VRKKLTTQHRNNSPWTPFASITAAKYSREEGTAKRRYALPPLATGGLASATGFYSCAEDLCRFASALCLSDETLFTGATKREMHHPHWTVPLARPPRSYALGLDIMQINGRALLGHGGVFPGYITRTLLDPAEQLVVTALTNCVDGPALEIAVGIVRTLDFLTGTFSAAADGKKKTGTEYLGRFSCIWKDLDLVQIGKRAYAANQALWDPFQDCEELSVLDRNTLKVERCDGYRNQGELVKLQRSGKRIVAVNYAGTTLVPDYRYSAASCISKIEEH